MVKFEEITLEKVSGGAYLTDVAEGFGEELCKLRTIADMISCPPNLNGGPMNSPETLQGLYYILKDIADRIEEGLAHLDNEIKAGKPAIQIAEEALKYIENGPPSMRESAKAELGLAVRSIVNEITKLMVVKERCQARINSLGIGAATLEA